MASARTGPVMQTLQPSEDAARRFWQGEFARWFRRHAYPSIDGTGAAGVYPFFEVRLSRILEMVAQLAPGRLLDIGCGGGHVMSAMFERGWTGSGCDFSRPMLSYARERMSAAGLQPRAVVEGRATDLSRFESNTCDLVLCLGPLEYLSADEASRAFSEIARVLRSGAVAITAHVNALFDLISLDKFTIPALTELVRAAAIVPDSELARVDRLISERLGGAAGGGESIRSVVGTRTDNPLAIGDNFSSAGLKKSQIVFYRYYSAPPFVERSLPDYQKETLDAEKELARSWLGHFLASGFLVLWRCQKEVGR